MLAAGGGYWYLNSGPAYPLSTKETRRPPPPWTPPSRQEMLSALKASGVSKGREEGEIFDLLIVGGGATGAGVAVDAASRGLKVALVERDDFSAGSVSFHPFIHRVKWLLYQELRRNQPNSYMVAFGTSKKQFSSWIMTSTSSFARHCTSGGLFSTPRRTYPICCPSCCPFTSNVKNVFLMTIYSDNYLCIGTGKSRITLRAASCTISSLGRRTWSRPTS